MSIEVYADGAVSVAVETIHPRRARVVLETDDGSRVWDFTGEGAPERADRYAAGLPLEGWSVLDRLVAQAR